MLMNSNMQRKLYIIMAGGALVGFIASFLQMLEVLQLIKNQGATLYCNINSVFSCSTVLTEWQSSVFGFPNSILCMVMFLTFLIAALAGMFSKGLNKGFRLTIQGLSMFTLCFGIWYLWQSTFVIGALCIFCSACMLGLLFVCAAWLRLNVDDLPLKANSKKSLKNGISKQYDILGWILFAIIGALAITLHFI